jgi:hypothetical protein
MLSSSMRAVRSFYPQGQSRCAYNPLMASETRGNAPAPPVASRAAEQIQREREAEQRDTALPQKALVCHSSLAKDAIMARTPEASTLPVRLALTALKC